MKNRTALIMLFVWSIVTLVWWGIAFYPSPNSLAWLQVAREVCFGVTDTGLPQTYGWIMLIMAPIACLSVLIVGWKNDIILSLKNLHSSKVSLIILPVIFSLIFLEYTWVRDKLNYAQELKNINNISTNSNFPKDYYKSDKTTKDFELIDQSGNLISLSGFKGKTVMLTFAFAHCQTVCPLLVTRAVDALKALNDPNVKLLIITLDPWRDTPGSLPFLAEKWMLPDSAYVLSGEIEKVNAVIESFGVPTNRSQKDGDIQHPAVTFIINKNNKISYILNKASTKWLKQAVKRIQTETIVVNK